jgi:stage II sporulation protein D
LWHICSARCNRKKGLALNFFETNGKFDQAVRRVTALVLVALITVGGFTFMQSSGNELRYEAAEYVEPNVRVALTLEDEGYSSYSVTTTNGYRFGIIDCITDEFTVFGSCNLTDCRGDLDNNYYIEVYSLAVGESQKDLQKEEDLIILYSLLAGYGMEMIPSYNDGFCYRMGPFTSAEEATVMMEAFMTDIDLMNQINAESGADQYLLGVRVAEPTASSVLFSSTGGVPLFCFSSSGDRLALAVEPIGEDACSKHGSYTYPGIIEFRRYVKDDYNVLIVVNILPLETYVPCVNSWEIYTTWPLETHKTFSVLVRTYTVRSGSRHWGIRCDMCYDIDCQAYKGNGKVNESVAQAAKETAGQILSYNGQPAAVFYSAVSGGSTVNCEEAWYSSDIPYLKAKPAPWEKYLDYDRYTTRAEWHKEFTGLELYNKLKATGSHAALKGEIVDVHIDQYCTNSNYIYQITYTDKYGNTSTTKRSDTIRKQLGFDSANFVVGKNGQTVSYPEYSLDCFPSVYSEGYNGYGEYLSFDQTDLKGLLSDLSTVGVNTSSASVLFASGRNTYNLKNYNVKVLKSSSSVMVNEKGLPDILNGKTVFKMREMTLQGSDGKFIFEGRGWGHGIGFSQYGIWDLTLLGYDYKTIFAYYLTDSEIIHISDLE